MKLICVVFLVIGGISACKTDVVETEPDKAEAVIFSKTELPCIKEQKRGLEKMGIGLTGNVEKLLEFLLAGKDENQIPACTKL